MRKVPKEITEGLLISADPDSSSNDGFDVIKLVHVLKSSFWILLVVFPLVFLISWLYVRYTKPMYESSSVIKLKQNSESQVLGLKMGTQQTGNLAALSGEIEIIKSQLIFDQLIEKQNLGISYFEHGKILDDEKFKNNAFYVEFKTDSNSIIYDHPFQITFKSNSEFEISYTSNGEVVSGLYQVGKTVDITRFKFKIGRNSNFSKRNIGVNYFFIINSKGALNSYIRNNLQVEILNPIANTIQILFKDHNENKAVDIVNTIDAIYLEQTLESKRLEQEQVINFINEQLDNTSKSLENSEIQLEDFVRKSGTNNPTSDFGLIKGHLEVLNEEKLNLRLESELLDEVRRSLLSDTGAKFVPTISNLKNPQLEGELNALNMAYKELERLTSTSSQKTLAYKSKIRSVENLENSVLEYVFENRKQLLEQTYLVNEKIQKLHDDFLGLPSKNTELTRLKRFYDLWEKFYLLLIEKRVEYGILKAGTVPEFIILSPASAPGVLVYPKKIQVYSIGFIVALMISSMLIVIRFLMHNKVITINDLERSLKAPVLGMIPEFNAEKLEHSSLVIDRFPKSAVTEALRSIRTNLDFISPGKIKKLITVTSTISGEGKTFVAINMGGVLAISGQRVIVLDLDMRKPKLHLGFDAVNDIGMSTLLIKKNELEDCIKKTKLPNLDFIGAGPLPPNPSELILLPELDNLIKKLHEVYDIVIIDTPPVGLVTDGLLVMRKADVPLYVVRSGYSQRRVDKNINNLYDSGHFKKLSVVLNAVEKIAGYGYGYGYGDHGYYEEGKKG